MKNFEKHSHLIGKLIESCQCGSEAGRNLEAVISDKPDFSICDECNTCPLGNAEAFVKWAMKEE